MLSWIVINSIFSVLALSFISFNKDAPHRLRFFVCFTALVCWLLPWQTVSAWIPDFVSWEVSTVSLRELVISASPDIRQLNTMIEVGAVGAERSDIFDYFGQLQLILYFLFTIGMILFIRRILSHRFTMNQLESDSFLANELWHSVTLPPGRENSKTLPQIRIQKTIKGALCSGLRNPVIWIHHSIKDSPQLQAVLLHEYTHIRQNDNYYLLAMTFIESLMWWNPLARILANSARSMQELSCDEICNRQLNGYRVMLASLVVDQLYSMPAPLRARFVTNISVNKHFDAERIKILARTYPMKAKHVFSTSLIISFTYLSINIVNVQADQGQTATDITSTTSTSSRSSDEISEFEYQPGTYTVQRSDSLSEIAKRFNISLAALKFSNKLNSNNIKIGQVLSVGGATDAGSYEHTVVRGETLSEIAGSYGISISSLRQANALASGRIMIGQVLKIPSS